MDVLIWGAPHLQAELGRLGHRCAERATAEVAVVAISDRRDLGYLQDLASTRRALPILAVTDEPSHALAACEAGALGVVGAGSVAELVDALHEIAGGQPTISLAAARGVISALRERASRTAVALTPRERAVLALLADGHTAPRIASRLGLQLTTVQTHLRNIYRKLDVRSKATATAFAIRHQLV